jgi:flagellar biosynthetic protein FlhB
VSDQSQRTEKPTQQRVRKARQEGRFAVSKEFVASLQFLAFVAFLAWGGSAWLDKLRLVSRRLLASSSTLNLSTANVPLIARDTLIPLLLPLLSVGMGLAAISLAAQLGTTRMGFAVSKLAPDFSRLNPIGHIRQFPRRNLGSLMQALLLLPLFGFAVYAVAKSNLSLYLSLPLFSLETGLHHVFGSLRDLLWRAAAVFLLIGALDFFRQNRLYQKDLRMTRQEVRDEMKESEGNPQVKGRIRRLQRDLLRRQMMKEVPKATAVIVNPTHFAVAIRYSLDSAGAPRVVAKGKNLIALRIRAIAMEHQVPIVENPPLAQALYKSVKVGDEIPANLYRAVAEVLAYIYRLMNQRLPG